MKNDSPNERDTETQSCRNLWAEVLSNAMDLASKAPKHLHGIQSRQFVEQQTGTFKWICEQLDLDPQGTSQAMMAAIRGEAT